MSGVRKQSSNARWVMTSPLTPSNVGQVELDPLVTNAIHLCYRMSTSDFIDQVRLLNLSIDACAMSRSLRNHRKHTSIHIETSSTHGIRIDDAILLDFRSKRSHEHKIWIKQSNDGAVRRTSRATEPMIEGKKEIE